MEIDHARIRLLRFWRECDRNAKPDLCRDRVCAICCEDSLCLRRRIEIDTVEDQLCRSSIVHHDVLLVSRVDTDSVKVEGMRAELLFWRCARTDERGVLETCSTLAVRRADM